MQFDNAIAQIPEHAGRTDLVAADPDPLQAKGRCCGQPDRVSGRDAESVSVGKDLSVRRNGTNSRALLEEVLSETAVSVQRRVEGESDLVGPASMSLLDLPKVRTGKVDLGAESFQRSAVGHSHAA